MVYRFMSENRDKYTIGEMAEVFVIGQPAHFD
jgi:hypothetical protein